MATTRVELDQSTMKELALGAEGIGPLIESKVAEGLTVAEGLSVEFTKTGEYLGSFQGRTEVQRLSGADRIVGIVENTSDHAAGRGVGKRPRPPGPPRPGSHHGRPSWLTSPRSPTSRRP